MEEVGVRVDGQRQKSLVVVHVVLVDQLDEFAMDYGVELTDGAGR